MHSNCTAIALIHIVSKYFLCASLPDYYKLNKKSKICHTCKSLAVAKYLSKKHEITPYNESRDIPYNNAKTICHSLDVISTTYVQQGTTITISQSQWCQGNSVIVSSKNITSIFPFTIVFLFHKAKLILFKVHKTPESSYWESDHRTGGSFHYCKYL